MLSWNVNGIRAIGKKGFLEWLKKERPDFLCLQETKAFVEQVPEDIRTPEGYFTYWNSPKRKGYAGVAVYTVKAPIRIEKDFSFGSFDTEGRFLALEYDDFFLINVYFPNGGASPERLKYKMDFYDRFLGYCNDRGKKDLIVCGDFNTAHYPIDLARPKQNELNSGFLPEERAWMDRFSKAGFVDTFRENHTEKVKYSWWDYKTRSRERNVGWRIDYFFVSRNIYPKVRKAFIMNDVYGSDHCPVGIDIDLS